MRIVELAICFLVGFLVVASLKGCQTPPSSHPADNYIAPYLKEKYDNEKGV